MKFRRFAALVPALALTLAMVRLPAAAQSAAQSTTQNAAVPAGNPLAAAAANQGISACAARIGQVSGFLGFGPAAGALLMFDASKANQRLASVAMETPGPGGTAAFATSDFAPNQVNGCGASYDAVNYWPQSCKLVRKQFAPFPEIGRLRAKIAVLDGGRLLKVFLMPAGAGCVSIKKELVQ